MTKTLEQWQSDMKSRFPGGSDTVAFVCPACGNVATIADFKAAGLSENDAPQQCIFRDTDREKCDWAAFGLLRGPVILTMPDGREVPVFDFAQEPR